LFPLLYVSQEHSQAVEKQLNERARVQEEDFELAKETLNAKELKLEAWATKLGEQERQIDTDLKELEVRRLGLQERQTKAEELDRRTKDEADALKEELSKLQSDREALELERVSVDERSSEVERRATAFESELKSAYDAKQEALEGLYAGKESDLKRMVGEFEQHVEEWQQEQNRLQVDMAEASAALAREREDAAEVAKAVRAAKEEAERNREESAKLVAEARAERERVSMWRQEQETKAAHVQAMLDALDAQESNVNEARNRYGVAGRQCWCAWWPCMFAHPRLENK
jgi:chromosome segregation ATPase